MNSEERIKKITEIEWEMFHAVNNVGGKADCQNNFETFHIMRESQLIPWSEKMQLSWLHDLEQARDAGRNLMTEKYAWMMESTAPAEFAMIKDKLPEVDDEAREMVDKLTAMTVKWAEAFREKYPYISHRGRPIHASEDLIYGTSIETYNKGELMTYSKETLKAFCEYYDEKEKNGENLYREIIENTVKLSGFESLDHAEAVQKKSFGL